MASKIKAAIREVEKISAAVGGRDTTPAKWMGKWEAGKSYGTLQKVEHLGNSYVCIKNCASVGPEADVALGDGVEGDCWLLIARKGDDGEGIESIDEVGGGEEVDGNRVVSRWKDYRITYASGKTLDYRVFGGADGKQGPAGAGITNIFFKEATEEGNVYYIQVGQNIYPFTAPKGDNGVSPDVTVTPIANGHRITITDAAGQKSFDVMDGEDGNGGGGTGDMMAKVYDPQGKAADIFAYVDEKLEGIDVDVTADEVTFADGDTFQQKYDNGDLDGPEGPPGVSGVYIGSEEPENANVWIDPSGQMDVGGQVYPERWTFELSDGITVVEKMVVLG